MKLFDIDFESFRLESFETEKSQIFEELKQLAQLYYQGIEKRRYELYEKSLELVTKKNMPQGDTPYFGDITVLSSMKLLLLVDATGEPC